MKRTDHHKAFEKLIRQTARRWHVWQVFSDFCEMAAIALYNAVFHDEEREARYMDIVGRYNKEEATALAQMLGVVVEALEDERQDFLGEMFMQLELGSHWHGQFFTPYELCHLMAGLQFSDEAIEHMKGGGIVTVSEPACGAGAMIIAMTDALIAKKVNYQQAMHVTAVDVDATAAHMAYIQLTLLHIPAYVINGNTLTMETRKTWITPAHVIGNWDYKLNHKDELGKVETEIEQVPASPIVLEPVPTERQIALF